MLRFLAALAALAGAAQAHVMSMSSGDIAIHGTHATYELRMPLYEIAHVPSPEATLFSAIQFSSAGKIARFQKGSCREEPALGMYVCKAEYEFASPVGRLDVECTLHSVTVPNHVHLLRAERDGKRDQAIFDFSFTKAEIRFDPPTVLETAAKQTGAGVLRALGGAVQILFLIALVLAARSPVEQLGVTAMFLLGQAASALLVPLSTWQPAPRFVEAAMALTLSYLAVEILLLPEAGQRWLVAGILGAFHGLAFAQFLAATEFHAGYVLGGAAAGEVAVVAVLAFAMARLARAFPGVWLTRVTAGLLFTAGMVWFFVRLRS